MKRIIWSFLLCFFFLNGYAQEDYLKIIELKSENGALAKFTSVGIGAEKKLAEANAAKSLIHALFFDGVDGVNGGKPLVEKNNPPYTNAFFNSSNRYEYYVADIDHDVKPKKDNGRYKGTYTIVLRLRPLMRDVKKNTGLPPTPPQAMAKPTIMVVPYKKAGESYKSILEKDFDRRVAVTAVQKGFENMGIKTIDLQGKIDAAVRRSQYEDNAGVADSNDKQLLISSGSDVYVIVDIHKDITPTTSRVALSMKAYETASGTVWAAEDGWTNRFKTNKTDLLCAYAVKDNLPSFLAQIEKNYSQPSRVVLQVALAGHATSTLKDMETSDGDLVVDFLQDWLDENAYEGDYHMQGVVGESVVFDYVMIPRTDAKGRKMTASKFLRVLKKELKERGVEVDYNIEGNNIMLILCEGM